MPSDARKIAIGWLQIIRDITSPEAISWVIAATYQQFWGNMILSPDIKLLKTSLQFIEPVVLPPSAPPMSRGHRRARQKAPECSISSNRPRTDEHEYHGSIAVIAIPPSVARSTLHDNVPSLEERFGTVVEFQPDLSI